MRNNDYNNIYLNVLKSTLFIHTARIACLTNIYPALPYPVPEKVFVLALAIYLSCLLCVYISQNRTYAKNTMVFYHLSWY